MAKVVALAIVPLGLGVAVAKKSQERRAEAVTEELFAALFKDAATTSQMEHLIANGADVNGHLTTGETPLVVAAIGANIDSVRVLIDQGADVNERAGWQGAKDRPLYHALFVLETCLNRPKDFDARIHKIIQLLKDAGAKE